MLRGVRFDVLSHISNFGWQVDIPEGLQRVFCGGVVWGLVCVGSWLWMSRGVGEVGVIIWFLGCPVWRVLGQYLGLWVWVSSGGVHESKIGERVVPKRLWGNFGRGSIYGVREIWVFVLRDVGFWGVIGQVCGGLLVFYWEEAMQVDKFFGLVWFSFIS